jgi:hypothetical protein
LGQNSQFFTASRGKKPTGKPMQAWEKATSSQMSTSKSPIFIIEILEKLAWVMKNWL